MTHDHSPTQNAHPTPNTRSELSALCQRLDLLRQATRALGYALAAGLDPHAPPPGHPSRAIWQRAVAGRRAAAAAGGQLFLDDLFDGLGRHGGGGGGGASAATSPQKTGGRATRTSAAAAAAAAAAPGTAAAAASYPWASPAAAVEALFGGGDGAGEGARRARLALLFYFLADGGWLGGAGGAGSAGGGVTPAGFARAFDLPPGLVAQWEAQQLLDAHGAAAAAAASQQPQQEQHLARACDLLLGSAGAATPFRVVEALVAAGRPAQALAVERARGGGGAGGGGGGLHEARVLLAARLECGLLHEAHGGVTLHCSRVRGVELKVEGAGRGVVLHKC
jgi:hypothetical protein